VEPDLYCFDSPPLLIVLSGPAGVGKDTVLDRLREIGPPLRFVVTATDRPARPGEVHGVDYFFYPTAEFERMISEGELLEHANVYGQHKGIPSQQVRVALDSGEDVIMRVDVQGAKTVRKIAPDALSIFLAPSNEEELRGRLLRRGADSPEQLACRLEKVREEMTCAREFDYVVVNRENQLDRAVSQVIAIIEAEHCRARPRIVQL
jgi:guanylate kinase